MEQVTGKLRVRDLRARLALYNLVSGYLAREFEAESLTFNERSAIAHQWDSMVKGGYVLQLMLDLLKRQTQEKRQRAKSGVPPAPTPGTQTHNSAT